MSRFHGLPPALLLFPVIVAGLLACPRASLALKPVIVDEKTDKIALGLHVEYLEDAEKKWTIEDVSSEAFFSKFVKSEEEVPSFGFTNSVYWLRFSLQGAHIQNRNWLLELRYPVIDQIELYFRGEDGAFHRQITGDHYPFEQRAFPHRNFVFALHVPHGEARVFYLRAESESAFTFPLTIWTAKSFYQHYQRSNLALGLFYGLLLIMILYNLFLCLAVMDRSYLFYVLFVCSATLFLSNIDGLSQQYLWPSSPRLGNLIHPVAVFSTSMWATLFAKSFLRTKEHLPGWNPVLTVLFITAGCGAALSLFISYFLAMIIGIVTSLVTAILAVAVGVLSLLRGQKTARYYLLAWSVFILGVLLLAFSALGIFPTTGFTELTMHTGLAMMVVLLSFALADRINIIRREKAQAQKEALDLQRNAAENLEREVERKTRDLQERTQELELAYARLTEHDRLKSNFFANVSHELRTPLTLILTPLQRLLAGGDETRLSAVKDQLRSMSGNTQRLLRLVNQLLDFSRLESGAATASFELLDIRAMVAALVHGFMPFARSKELKLELRVPDDLPEVYVDPVKLEKSVSNLLSNACKFTDRGGTVLVRMASDDKALKIAIKDSGIGIAQEDLPKIFERFRQADGGAARRFEGTGIGLALSKELVELMGGTLEVDSDLGVGSTFTVTLPLGKDHIKDPSLIRSEASEADSMAHARAAATALAAETGLREETDGVPAAGHAVAQDQEDTAKPLLLVVEDNPDMRALVADICQEDFRVIEAENGRIGLEKIQKQHPGLVVLDVMMPEMDGHEVLRRVRADPATASLPVILLTAKAGPEMKLEGLEAGADDYLSKPFESRELLARARNLVRLQEQERQLREMNARLQQEVIEQSTALEQARALQRYLPPEVVKSVIEGGATVQVGQQLCRLTCFRLELRGFDQMLEKAEPIVAPEDMATMLNAYLSEMMEVAFDHGATVDKFIRDTVVGFFGAPRSEGPEQDAVRCANMAVDMWERAVAVCQRWRAISDVQLLAPTMVLSSGHATVGNFGSSTRLEYTAMGGPVDETSALLSTLEPGVVACSQKTWILIQDKVKGEPTGEVTLRGGSQPLKLYRLAGSVEGFAPTVESTHTFSEPQKTGPAGPPARSLSKGMVLAERYEIVRPLGEGGMGTVYKARDLKLGSDVALKLLKHDLSGDDSRRTRIYREVRLAQLVSHRNVDRIYDLQTWEGFEFISMEFVQGQTLAERLTAGGALSAAEGTNILQQLCAGLAAAHAANIVHRDLKPSNIMIEEGGRVVIMDFGIARWGSSLHETQGLVGSPRYMAPEQFKGSQVDHRADIYALGVVAYEMLTGQKPFDAENAMTLAYKHTHEPPPDPVAIKPDLPLRLAAVILRCLEKVPAKRFGSVVEIASLLERPRPVHDTATAPM